MEHPSRTNQELIETNTLLKQKIQQLEHLGSEREQIKEALQASEEKYRTLIQKIQTADVVHRPDTRIQTCNP